MTLVLTELSPFGIAMAADSAVTYLDPGTGGRFVKPNAAEKLQVIPWLHAGLACWGIGEINGKATDEWIAGFIRTNSGMPDLPSFANALAAALQTHVGPSPKGEPRLGFHLAGYEKYNGEQVPSFYHIHDGPSTTLQARGLTVDPHRFNANHDMPPGEFLRLTTAEGGWITRNGDYILYAQLFNILDGFFEALAQENIMIPNSQNLTDRAEYLVFQIRTVSDLYRMSNLVPGIGGAIKFLTISPAGLHRAGISYH
jgi:hypothetical protein